MIVSVVKGIVVSGILVVVVGIVANAAVAYLLFTAC